jgi:hypothetical protein
MRRTELQPRCHHGFPVDPGSFGAAPSAPGRRGPSRPLDAFEPARPSVESAARASSGPRARRAAAPLGPLQAGYEAQPAAAKQAALWSAIQGSAWPELPGLHDERPLGDKLGDVMAFMGRKHLDPVFDTVGDVRPPRRKLVQTHGATAKVRFEAEGEHPFTGMFATGGPGIVRLSLATDERKYSPAVALKLLADGRESQNVLAGTSFDPQDSKDFFRDEASNLLPDPKSWALRAMNVLAGFIARPTERPIEGLAHYGADGRDVRAPVAPRQIYLVPGEGVGFADDTQKDFRAELAELPPGTVLYEVWARAEGSEDRVRIGRLRLESSFVASEFGDRELFFKHAR